MNADKLVRMANEIARNLRLESGDRAAHATAQHLRSFWTPGMCATVVAHLDAGGEGLDPLAREAVALVRTAAGHAPR